MNTLTHFIDAGLSLSTQLTNHEARDFDGANANGLYEVIENETLSSRNLEGLAVSGSLFSLTTFTDVVFESCVFYASKFENCTFINCTFKNCKFEFTGITHCRFNNCNLENTDFQVSPIKKCTMAFCDFDHKAQHYLSKEENALHNCSELAPLTWEEALHMEEVGSTVGIPLPKKQEEVAGVMVLLGHVLSKLKAA